MLSVPASLPVYPRRPRQHTRFDAPSRPSQDEISSLRLPTISQSPQTHGPIVSTASIHQLPRELPRDDGSAAFSALGADTGSRWQAGQTGNASSHRLISSVSCYVPSSPLAELPLNPAAWEPKEEGGVQLGSSTFSARTHHYFITSVTANIARVTETKLFGALEGNSASL